MTLRCEWSESKKMEIVQAKMINFRAKQLLHWLYPLVSWFRFMIGFDGPILMVYSNQIGRAKLHPFWHLWLIGFFSPPGKKEYQSDTSHAICKKVFSRNMILLFFKKKLNNIINVLRLKFFLWMEFLFFKINGFQTLLQLLVDFYMFLVSIKLLHNVNCFFWHFISISFFKCLLLSLILYYYTSYLPYFIFLFIINTSNHPY